MGGRLSDGPVPICDDDLSMHTDPSQVLTADELLAADRLFAELLAEHDTQSPLVDLAARAAVVRPADTTAAEVAAAS